MLKLKFHSQSPPYPFVNSPIEIELYLFDEHEHLRCGEEIELYVKGYVGDAKEYRAGLIDIVKNSGIKKNGTALITVIFRDVSMTFDNKKLYIHIGATTQGHRITSVISTPMICVRHKLVVYEEYREPYVWYKDEGGKDKSIDIKVSLRDANDEPVLNRKVPLKAVLNYSSGEQVLQQNILALSPDSRLYIDESGCGMIKLRINEVSNRHRGNMFQVEICPDVTHAPLTSDISPARCYPVDVKSKRNATNKSRQLQMASHMHTSDVQAPKRARQESASSVTSHSKATNVPMTLSSSIGSSSSSSSSSLLCNTSLQGDCSPRINAPLNHGPSVGLLSALRDPLLGLSSDNCMGGVSGSGNGPHSSASSASSSSMMNLMSKTDMLMDAAIGVNNMTCQPETLRDAMTNIVSWATTIMHGVEAIQWRDIGFASNADGSLNRSKPLYSIPDPTKTLNDIVEQYCRHVIGSLQYLQAAADKEDQALGVSGLMQVGPSGDKLSGQNDFPMPFELTRDTSFGLSFLPMSSSLDDGGVGGCDKLDPPKYCKNNSLFLEAALNQTLSASVAVVSSSGGSNLVLGGGGGGILKTSGSRGVSSALPMPALQSSTSASWGHYNSIFDTVEPMVDCTVLLETHVRYIVAVPFHRSTGALGLPAFDLQKELIGFYREVQDSDVTLARFVPLDVATTVPLTSREKLFVRNCLTRRLEQATAEHTAAACAGAFSLANSGNNLDKMKEDAVIFSWSCEQEIRVPVDSCEGAAECALSAARTSVFEPLQQLYSLEDNSDVFVPCLVQQHQNQQDKSGGVDGLCSMSMSSNIHMKIEEEQPNSQLPQHNQLLPDVEQEEAA